MVTVLANTLVVCLIWVLESERLTRHTSTKLVLYDRIELIVPQRRQELIADLDIILCTESSAVFCKNRTKNSAGRKTGQVVYPNKQILLRFV